MDGQYRPAATRRRPPPPPPLVRDYDDLGDDQEIGVFTADRYFSGAVDAAEDSSNGAQLWCDRSSSSLSLSSASFKAGAVMDWSAPTLTAGTSSSEASWNSRSVLLPPKPPVVVAAVPVDVESKPSGEEESGHEGGRHSSSSSSSSLLVRWLLGVAGCACPGGGFGGDVDAAAAVDGGKKRSTEADAVLPGRTRSEAAVEEPEVTTARVRPGNWDVDVDGDAFHAGTATLPPLQLVEPRHLRGTTGELSMRVLNPTATDERRRKSSGMFHPSAGRHGMSTLAPAPAARQQLNSAFTIVAGRTARDDVANRARASIPRDSGVIDDDASAELECVYAPSEASVVWSVVTADGAASAANFSSAASGYYHYYDYHNDGDVEAAAKSNRRGRGNGGNGLLMGCVSGSAVDAIGPAQPGAAAGSRQPGTRGAAHVARRR